jgi:hypothetical protein
MAFQVTWQKHAQEQLAHCWLAARDRQRIGEASLRIDGALEQSPDRGRIAGKKQTSDVRGTAVVRVHC